MKNFLKTNKLTFLSILLFGVFSISASWAQCGTEITGVTVTEIGSTYARFTWPAVSPETGVQYTYEIRTAGAPGSSVNPATGYVASGLTPNGTTSFVYSNLRFNTVYYFYVRYECVANTTYSPWQATGSNTFTTAALQPPVATAGIYVTDESFTAQWNPVFGASSYRLDVSKSPTFAAGFYVTGFQNKVVTITSQVVNPTTPTLTPNTTYYYRVRAVGLGGQPPVSQTSANSNTITVTTSAVPPTNAVWSQAGWSTDPTYELDIDITWDYNTGVGGTQISFGGKSLTVEPNVTLTIAEATSVVIDGNIVNDGKIIVENNASLVQYDPAGVFLNVGAGASVEVKRNSSSLWRLDYTMWSSPLTGTQTLQDFSPATSATRFYNYNTLDNNFNQYASTNTFTKGDGYLIRMPNNWVSNPAYPVNPQPTPVGDSEIWSGSFINGTPNTGTIPKTLVATGQGFNMVGNPYPSVISADSFLAINENAINGMVYFWRRTNAPPVEDTGSYYATYNILGDTSASADSEAPNGFIQVGQGFLVQDNSGDGTDAIEFNNDMRIYDNFDNQFFRQAPKKIEKNRLWFNLTNTAGVFSQTLLGYMTDASNDLDKADGKYINDSEVALTSYFADKEYTTQARALPFDDKDIVPLSFKTPNAGDYTIALSKMDGFFTDGQDVYLRDKLTNTVTDMKAGAYTFSTEAGVFNDRFEVVYNTSSLSTTNPTIDANSVVVYKSNQALNINTGVVAMKSLELYDMSGRVIYKAENVDATKYAISNISFQDQIIIVKINTEAGIVSKKFSWTK